MKISDFKFGKEDYSHYLVIAERIFKQRNCYGSCSTDDCPLRAELSTQYPACPYYPRDSITKLKEFIKLIKGELGMKKEDLKTGMIVVMDDGVLRMVLGGTLMGIGRGGGIDMNRISQNLSCVNDTIMKVYGVPECHIGAPIEWLAVESNVQKHCDLLWERDSKAKSYELTLCNVKSRGSLAIGFYNKAGKWHGFGSIRLDGTLHWLPNEQTQKILNIWISKGSLYPKAVHEVEWKGEKYHIASTGDFISGYYYVFKVEKNGKISLISGVCDDNLNLDDMKLVTHIGSPAVEMTVAEVAEKLGIKNLHIVE